MLRCALNLGLSPDAVADLTLPQIAALLKLAARDAPKLPPIPGRRRL